MKVAIYARVSGRAQALKGTSVKDQVKRCRAWAKEQQHRVVDVYSDEGVSGVKLDRPQLARLLVDATARRIDAVIVYDLDRLARELVVQETIIGELHRNDVELHSVNQPNLEGDADPWRVFARQIFGASAQLHKSMTVLRLKAGRVATKERTGFCEGAPRYGFRRGKGGTIEVDTREQAGVDLMRRLRNSRPRKSYRAIAAELDKAGIPPKRGSKWHPDSVRRTLKYGNKPH